MKDANKNMNINPQEIFERLTAAGEQWVYLDAIARTLEENQKSEFSTIALGFKEAKSVAEAEMRARASKDFKEYNVRMCEARKNANEAKVKYDSAKCWFEALRTQAANIRTETRMGT